MPVLFKRKVINVGNSVAVTIPRDLVETCNITSGKTVQIAVDGVILLDFNSESKETLLRMIQLFERVLSKNRVELRTQLDKLQGLANQRLGGSDRGDSMAQRNINLHLLKKRVRELPPGSTFREVVLAEPDYLSPQDFLGRIPVWLRLAEREGEVIRQ